MAQLELLVEERDEAFGVSFFDGPAVDLREKCWDEPLGVCLRMLADQFDRDQMHGGWVENVAGTRVTGADMPPEPKPVIPRDLVGQLGPAQVRTAAPDGMLGGAYARPDEDMQAVWDAGVAEVRALLENGWLR